MSSQAEIMGGGIPAETARAIVGRVTKSVTATGTMQATAYPLGAALAIITTTPAGSGVQLPRLDDGDTCVVVNLGANALLVYPPYLSNRTINGGAANVPATVAVASAQTFRGSGDLNCVTINNGTTDAALLATNLAASSGSSMVGEVRDDVTGGVAHTLHFHIKQTPLNLKADFNALGDGVNDNSALSSFFSNASNRICLLPAGTYRASSLLSYALSNCHLIGVPGATTIIGNFGYAVMRLLALDDVIFEGIEFKTDYVNAVEDGGASVLYSFGTDVLRTAFSRCRFTATNANTGGLSVYARDSAGSTAAVINGFWVEDCDFESIGRIACTLMNRGTAADKYEAAKRVFFRRNQGKDLGLSGSHGFLISLDGFGSAFAVDDNRVENALGIGIENAGWINGSLSDNQFDVFSSVYAPMSFSSATQMSRLKVVGNKTLVQGNSPCIFYNVDKSYIAGNSFDIAGAQAWTMRDCNDNKLVGNYWKSNGSYAAYVESASTTCKRNKFIGDTFDSSASGSNLATLRFNGASCSENKAIACVFIKGTGGNNYNETNSASNNSIISAETATSMFLTGQEVFNFASDADVTLTIVYHTMAVITLTDSGVLLTAGRNVILPTNRQSWAVVNGTAQILTFKTSAGTGIAVGAGKTAQIYGNGTNILRATADV